MVCHLSYFGIKPVTISASHLERGLAVCSWPQQNNEMSYTWDVEAFVSKSSSLRGEAQKKILKKHEETELSLRPGHWEEQWGRRWVVEGFTYCLLASKEEGYRSQSNIAFMMSQSRVLVVSPHRDLCGKMTNEQRSPPQCHGTI